MWRCDGTTDRNETETKSRRHTPAPGQRTRSQANTGLTRELESGNAIGKHLQLLAIMNSMRILESILV